MSERYRSPALRNFPANALRVVPLAGVEAQIYNRLWHSIMAAKLKPGIRLREETIGEVFGVSRTITRKVLQILEQEGAVYLPPHRGAYMAAPSPKDTAIAFEALETAAAHVISRLADPATTLQASQREMIEQHIEAQSAAEASHDRLATQLLSADFLVLLAAIHGNPIITELIDRMLIRQALSLMTHHQYPMPQEHAGFQRRLLDAILDHQPDQAQALFHERSRDITQKLLLNETGKDVDLAEILREP
jgi:DNA-binding GntR family transcriptional regulator